jgi:hypothetical protein
MRLLVIFFDSSETLLTSGLSTWDHSLCRAGSRCSFDVTGFLLLPAVCPHRVLNSSRYYLLANVLFLSILLCLFACLQFVIFVVLALSGAFLSNLPFDLLHYFLSPAIGASSHRKFTDVYPSQ